MVANSKALIQVLLQFILGVVTGHRTSIRLSPVHNDGTVVVRFISSPNESAIELSYRFVEQLNRRRLDFTQTDDTKFRVPIGQFRSMV